MNLKRNLFMYLTLTMLIGAIYWAYKTDLVIPPADQRIGNLSSVNREIPTHPSRETLSTQKEGWGFVKNKEHRPPRITAHQWKLVKNYGAIFIGNLQHRQVALTFDLGYEKTGYTEKILASLARYKVKAAFFTTGYWLEKNPDLAERIIKEGHILANHTWSHKSLPIITPGQLKDEIVKWDELAEATVGKKGKYLRPPMGEYSEQSLQLTKDQGYTTVFWSIALVDWLPMKDPTEAVTGVLNHLHNGAVILLHGNSEPVVAQIDAIIEGILKGYKIVSLDEISK